MKTSTGEVGGTRAKGTQREKFLNGLVAWHNCERTQDVIWDSGDLVRWWAMMAQAYQLGM